MPMQPEQLERHEDTCDFLLTDALCSCLYGAVLRFLVKEYPVGTEHPADEDVDDLRRWAQVPEHYFA